MLYCWDLTPNTGLFNELSVIKRMAGFIVDNKTVVVDIDHKSDFK